MDDTTKRRVRTLAAQGFTQQAIADQLSVSRGAVWRALQAGRVARPSVSMPDERPLGPADALHGWAAAIGLAVALLGELLHRRSGRQSGAARRLHRPCRAPSRRLPAGRRRSEEAGSFFRLDHVDHAGNTVALALTDRAPFGTIVPHGTTDET